MGTLEGPEAQRVHLRASHLIGRAVGCDLISNKPRVSGQHAVIRWTGMHWTVRDLGSTNGTWVDGVRLASGEEKELHSGARLVFGIVDELWTLSEVDPPAALAEALLTGELVRAESGLLALPDDDSPEISVRPTERGWVLERAGEDEPVTDGTVVEAGGQTWRLHLPQPMTTTESLDEKPRSVLDVDLHLVHSLDEENVELHIIDGDQEHHVPHRAHHELLLHLARQRIQDAQDPALPPAEHGWMHRDLLLMELRTSANTLHQQVHRARRQFQRLGWPDGADVVEGRNGQLRLGVPQLRAGMRE